MEHRRDEVRPSTSARRTDIRHLQRLHPFLLSTLVSFISLRRAPENTSSNVACRIDLSKGYSGAG